MIMKNMQWRLKLMKVKYRNFPHPVLAEFNDDFINDTFKANFDIKLQNRSYNINVDINLESDDLGKYIQRGSAKYGIHLESPFTQYRTFFKSNQSCFNFEIPAELLDGEVEMSAFIIADENIKSYKCRSFNQLFEKYSFSVNKGDVLAFGGQVNFFAETEIDSDRNISSIFAVQANDDSNPPALDLELNSEKIMIYLNPESFQKYKELKENQYYQTSFASMIVVPILTQIIESLKDNLNGENSEMIDNFRDRRWYRVLINKLDKMGVMDNDSIINENSVAVTQKLLENIIDKAFDDLYAEQSEKEYEFYNRGD